MTGTSLVVEWLAIDSQAALQLKKIEPIFAIPLTISARPLFTTKSG
jgi:hypothetical protein